MTAMAEEFAGALDEHVRIERWQSARDAAGDDAGAWVMVDRAFAAVSPDGPLAGGRTGEAVRRDRRWRVRLRRRDDLDLLVRLRWRDQILAVRAIEVAGRRGAFVTLLCDGSPA